MSAYKVDLSAAQNGASLNLSGRKIKITGASSPTAVATLVAVYADGYTRSPYVFKEQYEASSQMPFVDLKVSNAAQPGEWLEIEVTQSDNEWTYDPRDDIFIDSIANPVEIDSTTPIDVEITQPATLADAADLTLIAAAAHVQVLPALATRKSCLIKNTGTNTARIGSAPTNARGHLLSPNESFSADGTFEIRAFSQSGTTLSIIYTGA